MRILVTGGAGFIGSHLVEQLLALGHEVTNVDDLSSGRANFLADVANHSHYTFVHGSVLDRDLVREHMQGMDVVYHLAAVLGVKTCVEDPLKVIEGNVDGTRIVVEEAFRANTKVVFASTSEVYGKNAQMPFREDDDRVLGSTAKARWSYSTAKALDEHLCLAYVMKGLRVTIIRYFNAYGPRAVATAYGGVVPRFVRAALCGEPLYVYGTGEQRRCFTYVGDAVRGTVLAMEPKADGLIFNLGSPYEITVRELAGRICALAHSRSPIRLVSYEKAYGSGYEDMARRVPDLTRAKQVLFYEPSVDLQTGLKETIDWFREKEGGGESI